MVLGCIRNCWISTSAPAPEFLSWNKHCPFSCPISASYKLPSIQLLDPTSSSDVVVYLIRTGFSERRKIKSSKRLLLSPPHAVLAASVLLQGQHVKGQIRMAPLSPSAVKIIWSGMMWILVGLMLLQENKRSTVLLE